MSLAGTTAGRLRIVELLGQGGMGEVYSGYDETLKRPVALKAIRDEKRLDAETKARFLREARMLSQLDHPGICRIYEYVEGDDTDFLVLELIDGRSLKEALREDLGFSFKLFLAERVADALVAAHAKGIAHRDLKPENVMLTTEGGVKVLDFGLARTVEAEIAAGAESPPSSVSVLEPAEAPPPPPEDGDEPVSRTVLMSGAIAAAGDDETAATRAGLRRATDAIETRAGIVMGTVGYMSPEQARGERPSVRGDLYSFGLLLQELFTGEPPYQQGLPLMQLLTRVARAETRPVQGLDPDLRDLIERLKAFQPDARPSAVETAERLRWIRAKPGRRLLRRLAAALLLLTLGGGLKYTLDLREERRKAVQAQLEAEEIVEFFTGLFRVSDPRLARGEDVTARTLLDRGAGRIAGLADQPATQARLMATMGQVYRQLGLFETALPLARDALEIHHRLTGDDPFETARSYDLLANLHQDLGELDEAEPLFRQALEVRERAAGPRDLRVAASLNNLAVLYRDQGRLDLAEPLFRRALGIQEERLGHDTPEVAWSLNNLGDIYRLRGDRDRAVSYLEQSIAVQERVSGPDAPDLATSLNNLAMTHYQRDDLEAARPLYQRALAISEKVLGELHPAVATQLNNLAELHRATGEFAAAEPLYARALEIQRQILGPGHPAVAITLSNFADLLTAAGEGARAEASYREAVEILEEALGAGHPDLAVTLNHLADLYLARDDAGHARPLYQRALEIQENSLGEDHPGIAITLADLAAVHLLEGRHAAARQLLERSLALSRRTLEAGDTPAERHRHAVTLVWLGKLERAAGHEERAAAAFEEAADLMAVVTPATPRVAYLHTRALALLHLGRADEARPLVSKLLADGWSDPELLELSRRHGLS